MNIIIVLGHFHLLREKSLKRDMPVVYSYFPFAGKQ